MPVRAPDPFDGLPGIVPSGIRASIHHATATEAGSDIRHLRGQPVILVHGALDRAASFGRVVRRLDDLCVVVYDRRGYGRSSLATPATSLADHVDDLLALVGPGPVVVVGHSYGGIVAVAAALAAPRAVTAVAVYEPPMPWLSWRQRTAPGSRAPGQQRGSDLGRQNNSAPAGDAEAEPEDAAGDVAENFFRRVVGDHVWDGLPERIRRRRRTEGPALVTDLHSIDRHPAFDLEILALSRVPMIVATGDQSPPRYRQGADALVEARPDADVVVIEGAAHGAHLTHPGAFSELVRVAVAKTATAMRPAPI